MGYRSDEGWLPGVSVFRKQGQSVCRVSDTGFQPGDAAPRSAGPLRAAWSWLKQTT
jgi:hypothetical protein